MLPFGLTRPEGQLFVQTLRPYRLRILLRGQVEVGQRCVAVGPGAVGVALLLAELVGPAGEVLALDPSAADVQGGRALAESGGWQDVVELENVDLDEECGVRIPPLTCDVLYTVNLLAVSTDLDATGEMLASALPTCAHVVVEEQDLDQCGGAGSATPALRRWHHLRSELARRRGGQPEGAGRAALLLVRHGFDVAEVEAVQPAFVQGVGCRVPVAELEVSRPALLDAGLLTAEAAEELAREMTAEAGTPGQLVLWPRVVFVRAARVAAPGAGCRSVAEEALL